MKINFNYKPWLTAVCLAGAMLIPSAYAGVANNGLFELDANPQDDSGTPAPDDWATPPQTNVNNAQIFTGIIPDPYPKSVFDGGKKDIQDISSWSWKDGSVPDKDNLTNAYAAAYSDNGELILYFGADRFANTGDAFMGFWFFKQKVVAQNDGSFSGLHTKGDILVLVDYPQGANAVPYIAVVEWDTTCTKADSNDPTPTQCAAANLRLKSESGGAGSPICSTGSNQLACAITNHGDVNSPWAYTPKSGTDNVFPYESFFEGGINLSQLVGGSDNCFSSFMAETRSSSSFTASLKDFVLGNFETCGVTITKNCTAGDINDTETGFIYTFDGTVTNTGFGALYDVTVHDNGGTSNDTSDDFDILIGTIAKGASANYSGTFPSTLNPPINGVHVTAASTSDGEATITADASDECPGVNRDPRINVTKDCSTKVMSENNNLVIKVEYNGEVCNATGGSSGLLPITLNNVVIQDDAGTPVTPTNPNADADDPDPILIGTLAAGTCADYSGSYYPASAGSQTPAEISFSDTVKASGVAALGFGTPEDTATATCRLCPDCPDCPPPPPTTPTSLNQETLERQDLI